MAPCSAWGFVPGDHNCEAHHNREGKEPASDEGGALSRTPLAMRIKMKAVSGMGSRVIANPMKMRSRITLHRPASSRSRIDSLGSPSVVAQARNCSLALALATSTGCFELGSQESFWGR